MGLGDMVALAKGLGVAAVAVVFGGCVSEGFDHTVVMSGTACGLGIDYASSAGERIRVYQDELGRLRGVVVGECAPFDVDDGTMWNSCAAAHDLHVALWFLKDDADPGDTHAVLSLQDGIVGARDLGTLRTADHGAGERVAVDGIDFDRGEIALRLNLPIDKHDANYPPTEDGAANCTDDVVVGAIVGSFELLAHTD